MTDYISLRRALHDHPQTAGNEQYAHDLIVSHLQRLHPDKVYTHVGGYGVVALWGHDALVPTVALRADTDALPIGHRCGHDGHTTILLRTAELLDDINGRGVSGRNVLLLWQPAEETGQGARAVLESGILQQYNIVAFYALHNIPGYALGTVVLCPRTFAAASTGVVYRMDGRETHASTPELGLNPGLAVAETVERFARLNVPPDASHLDAFRQSTLICVRLGAPAFGTSAGHAEAMFTLRAFTNDAMERLLAEANGIVAAAAARHRLSTEHSLVEPFRATENAPEGVEAIKKAADALSLCVVEQKLPFRWSEDFGEYLKCYRGAMLGMGSGDRQPELHHPDFDFPDALVETAARMMLRLAVEETAS